MKKNFLFFALLLTAGMFMTSCEKDEPEIENEEEVITTLNYTLTPSSGGAAVTLSFRDLDGDGSDAPVITGGTLAANQTYTGSIDLLNELESPAERITTEIESEDDEHQFFFTSSVGGLSVAYSDEDAEGNPVGLSSTLTTGSAATGNLTIILRHEPNKSGDGVKDGNIANAGGETDIEVTFPVTVQ